MDFLRNAWYAAAWSHDVDRNFFSRKILNESVLIYRTGNGKAAAMVNRCPHRFAPLHAGRLVDDAVECGYHGLRFGANGRCVFNPYGKQPIPKTLDVRSFPLEEKYGALWIWFGRPELADASAIPDFSFLTDPAHKTLYGTIHVRANYQLINDNVMDTSHSEFIHRDLTATGTLDPRNFQVTYEAGKVVNSISSFPDVEVPSAYKPYFSSENQRVDRSMTFTWLPPSLIVNRTLLVPVDKSTAGFERIGTHFLTPESESSSHYLFAHTRNFRLDDAALDDATRRWQAMGLNGQDRPIIEAVQESMLDAPATDLLRPALLATDTAAVRVRRILADLIAKEAATEASPLFTVSQSS
jgi:phenylpropionate dioxygenase-like ring-hydroxylating dioxygenase large terminal subunit